MDGAPFQTAHNESSVSELELELELPGKKVTLGLSLQMLDTAMIVMGRKGKSDQYSMHYNMHIISYYDSIDGRQDIFYAKGVLLVHHQFNSLHLLAQRWKFTARCALLCWTSMTRLQDACLHTTKHSPCSPSISLHFLASKVTEREDLREEVAHTESGPSASTQSSCSSPSERPLLLHLEPMLETQVATWSEEGKEAPERFSPYPAKLFQRLH